MLSFVNSICVLLQLILAKIHCKNEIVAVSGFRTQEEQEKIWNDAMAESGLDFTKKYVAVPRHSEPLPFGGKYEQAHEYWKFSMYISLCNQKIRYVSGKEQITGIGAEPWHFRYVGYPHSVIMTEKDMALEEYICFLKENNYA